jgi:tRNA pseudouridine38-40 synthase
MRNIRLIVAYDGTDFFGWQRQPSKPTIQGLLESELATILGVKIALTGSGRTDAGVHAAQQVANFRTSISIPCSNLVKALNDRLPISVRIKDAADVPASFHARYDVVSKTYRYRILLAPVASPFIARFVYHYPFPLDRLKMEVPAQLLEGDHDFTSFAASDGGSEGPECPSKTVSIRHNAKKVRTVSLSKFHWRPRTSILTYEIRGSGFLHHMVRNIVGTLIEVGRGALEPSDIPRIIAARDRSQAGPTAPAQGLCLWRVEY